MKTTLNIKTKSNKPIRYLTLTRTLFNRIYSCYYYKNNVKAVTFFPSSSAFYALLHIDKHSHEVIYFFK